MLFDFVGDRHVRSESVVLLVDKLRKLRHHFVVKILQLVALCLRVYEADAMREARNFFEG